ncbi:serine hydrolase domain-containing protein [Novosphingobium huizhouense]|uniref:serine hydrolase domain-containing protein n=1 Tax=Novosphingobium huizhouense TaxID=2866625 RepID=UPI001CD91487|nr:serine hydrolase domain-containing protein [Novosphingobium huizhouense]
MRALAGLATLALALSASTAVQAEGRLDAAARALAARGFTGEVLSGTGERRVIGVKVPERWVLGSVTKQIVAVAAARLVEEGKASWGDTLAARLPAFAGHPSASVTLAELFRHTSGLASPQDGVADDAVPPYLARGRTGDVLAPCLAAPTGERGRFRYNNCDTIVAGAMLEAASGETLSALLARTVFRPAGMRHTRFARPEEIVAFSASGNRIEVAGYGASGGLLGTADDIVRFDKALMAGKLVGEAQRKLLWQGEPSLGYVALGVWSFPARLKGCNGDVALVERRGDVDGTQARNIIAPALGRALVMLTPNPEFDFGEIWQGKGASYDLASAAFCG